MTYQKGNQKAVRRSTAARRAAIAPELESKVSIVDLLKLRLGFKPQLLQLFYTTAKRECGGCRVVKHGDQFDVPITPNRPDLNLCRECEDR